METTSGQYADGTLETALARQLRAHGLDPRPDRQRALEAEGAARQARLLGLLDTFIRASKNEALSDDELRRRVATVGGRASSMRSALFVRVAIALRAAWNRALGAAGASTSRT